MKKSRLTKFSPRNVPKLKRKLWKLVADAIKIRDKYTCYTCNKHGQGSFMHAGHFISRNHQATYFDPRNIHAQCINCNFWRGGELGIYASKLVEEYGLDGFNDLVKTSKQIKQWNAKQLIALIEAAKLGLNEYGAVYNQFKPKK